MVRCLKVVGACAILFLATAGRADAAPLNQIGSISLGSAKGTVGAMVMDYANQRLFVLEPDAGALAVADLAVGRIAQTVTGIAGPRGLARAPTDNRLYVATGESRLLVYSGVPLRPEGTVELGSVPGPLYYDAGSERIYLGLAGRKIAIIDSTHNKHWENIRLNAEPGPLALEDVGSLIFAGVRGQPWIMVADRDGNKQTGRWSTGDKGVAVGLALDEDASRLVAAFSSPPSLAWFDLASGELRGSIAACPDPGQLLSDPGRHRIYLTCGDGRIEVFARNGTGGYSDLGAVDTVKGATAALLVPTSGRLYLGVPAEDGHPAEVRIYAPAG